MGVRKINIEDRFSYDDYKEWEDSEDWEIIGGKPYMMAPSPNTKHQEIAGKIFGEIYSFLKDKPCKVYGELDVILSEEDIVKPDVLIVCDKNKITDKNIKGAPDLIVEILSPSTAKKDKVEKYNLYKKSGVREYWIVDQYNLEIDVHNFEKNEVSSYFYDEKMEENFVEVGIFGTELKLDVNYIFKE